MPATSPTSGRSAPVTPISMRAMSPIRRMRPAPWPRAPAITCRSCRRTPTRSGTAMTSPTTGVSASASSPGPLLRGRRQHGAGRRASRASTARMFWRLNKFVARAAQRREHFRRQVLSISGRQQQHHHRFAARGAFRADHELHRRRSQRPAAGDWSRDDAPADRHRARRPRPQLRASRRGRIDGLRRPRRVCQSRAIQKHECRRLGKE